VVCGTLVGPDGKPVAGAKAFGLTAYATSRNWARAPLKAADFAVYGLDTGQTREVLFWHEEKGLAGALLVGGNDQGPATVKMEPWGTVTGRLVTADGKPRVGVELVFAGNPVLNHAIRTDADGRFRIVGLLPGAKTTVDVKENGTVTGRAIDGLALKTGESRDLGDVRAK
jgi:hypothetical protein